MVEVSYVHVLGSIREHVWRNWEVVGREQRCSHLDSERDECSYLYSERDECSHLDSERDIKKLFRELLLITR